MTFWTDEKIRFLKEASEQLGFYRTLAEAALPYIPVGSTLCDAGCGLGYLALELAPYCREVYAADCAPEPLEVLRQNRADVPNLHILREDVFNMPNERRFDIMTFCFFGQMAETVACIARHCAGTAILYKKDWDSRRFSLSDKPLKRLSFSEACSWLEQRNIPFRTDLVTADLGQPFRTLSDARRFFALYSPGEGISDDRLKQLLSPTGSSEFPWLLSSIRRVGLIVLDADAVRAYGTNKAD